MDGAIVASTLSYVPTADLSLGVHMASATVTDMAGNSTNASWQFAVLRFTPQTPTASLDNQTVDVNPNGDIVGAPTTVTFTNVVIRLHAFEAGLSPAAFTGYGRLTSSIPLGSAVVRFANETPVTPDPVPANLMSVTFQKYAGVLLPTADQSTIAFKEDSLAVASVTVNVPTGYNTRGSRATISMHDQLGSVPAFVDLSLPISVPVPNLPVFASVSQSIEVSESSPDSVTVGSGTTPSAYIFSNIPGLGPVSWPFSLAINDKGLAPWGYSGPDRGFQQPPDLQCASANECLVQGRDAMGTTTTFL
ncbi:MAG: hypothetical protein LC723_07555, partial [Actinobacteria bacterium]|nr:hypothetical protein [Actinomycetota bacterium]